MTSKVLKVFALLVYC